MQKTLFRSKHLFFLLLAFNSVLCFAQSDIQWVNPSDKVVQTIYYQGMTNSQAQAAKYMGTGGFMATTGQWVVCDKAITVIQNLYIGQEIDEIKFTHSLAGWQVIHPNNIMDKIKSAIIELKIQYAQDGISVRPSANGQQQESVQSYSIELSKINIGQEGDIQNHFNKYEKCVNEHANADLILYGVSRGAATTFSAMATHHYPKVKLVILEGCFDSLENLITHRYSGWCKIPGMHSFIHSVISMIFPRYKKDGISPISLVEKFPKNIPVVFVTSKIDKQVPLECTKRLAQALVMAGHKQVYLLVLENSSHPRYMMDDAADTNTYQNFLHALYKKVQVPYIPEYALAGEVFLEASLMR